MKTLNALGISGAVAIAILATGCQNTTGMTHNDVKPTINTYQITNQALQANNWRLIDAKDANGQSVNALFMNLNKPLTLSFNTIEGTNMVNLMNTCNTISAPYTIVDGQVKLGAMMSTMKACPTAEAKFDSAAVASVIGKYTLSKAGNNNPVLVVTNDNQVAHFKAVTKAN